MLKINDAIHGFIQLPDKFIDIVDSSIFQRLRRIKQLSGANFVFPGANHTRFEHCLGAAFLAQKLTTYLRDSHKFDIEESHIEECSLAGLLHDIGHGPFSHNFEAILLDKTGFNHEDMGYKIIKETFLGDIIEEKGYDKNIIANIATGEFIGTTNHLYSLLGQIITSSLNVDTLDYILRDNYNCGTPGKSIDIDRLMLSMNLFREDLIGIEQKGLIALEGYFFTRISSFRRIYFHRTCRAVQIMIGEALKEIQGKIEFFQTQAIEDYLKLDEYYLYNELSKSEIFNKIKKRDILKCVFEKSSNNFELSESDKEKIRNELSEKTNVPKSAIFIDVPTSTNVPYSHLNEIRRNTIVVFKKKHTGEHEELDLKQVSPFFELFNGKLGITRIYTWEKYRKQLSKILHNLDILDLI